MKNERERYLLGLPPKDRAVELLHGDGVCDITYGFPAKDGGDYWQLMMQLFLSGVFRVPIIGANTADGSRVYALFTSGRQEHVALTRRLDTTEDEIEFATSLEGMPEEKPDYTWVEMVIDTGEGLKYQKMLYGSDRFGKPLTSGGRDWLNEKVFCGIGKIK